MGGGAAMRAAAKVAGIGVMTGGLRGGATSETFAARKSILPASVSVASSSAGCDQAGSLKVEPAVQRPVLDIDGWEFAGGEDDLVVDRFDAAKPRLVFGPVPTLEEAKEATSELKDALDKVYLSSPKSSGSADSSSSFPETRACITHESSVPKSAMQAFMLLKESPVAQTVVASIASDANVWNAVMQNPTLLEFLESDEKRVEFEVEQSSKSSVDNPGKADGIMGFIEDVKLTLVDMVSSLSNFVQSLFAFPDLDKKSQAFDGTPKTIFAAGSTFMALATMVIMVVLMKRG